MIKRSIISVLSLVAIVTFSACGGGSSDDNSESTAPTDITGYLADSGIEGMKYTTSDGFSGTTKLNGAFNCKQGTTVTFYLGKTQIGESVSCSSVPITPVELFNETQDSYQSNPEVVNALRLLQSLDSDGIHSNGIKISDDVMEKLETETIDFQDLVDIEDTLLSVAPSTTLVSQEDAIINFQDTLSSINANVFVAPSEKVKLFNSHSTDYFRLQRSIVDEDTKAVENNINVANSAFQSTVSSISTAIDKKGTLEVTDAMKKSAKDLLFPMVMMTLNLQPQEEAIAKLLTDITVDLILMQSLEQKDIDDKAFDLTKIFIANGATVLGHTFTEGDTGTNVASWIGMLLYTYDNVKALSSVDGLVTLTTNGINMTASLVSTTALIVNTNSFITTNGSLLVAQGYLELYYRNGESDLGVINTINENALWNISIAKLLDNASYDSVLETIAEGYFLSENDNPWYYLSSQNDYKLDEVKKIISDYKYKFELLYANQNRDMESMKLSGKLTINKIDGSKYEQMPDNVKVEFSGKCKLAEYGDGIQRIYEDYNGIVSTNGDFMVDLKSYDFNQTQQEICYEPYAFFFYIDDNQDNVYSGDDRHLETVSTDAIVDTNVSVIHFKVTDQVVNGTNFIMSGDEFVGLKLKQDGSTVYQTDYYYSSYKLVDNKLSIDFFASNVKYDDYQLFLYMDSREYVSPSETRTIFDGADYISTTDSVTLLDSLVKDKELVSFNGLKYIAKQSQTTKRFWLETNIGGGTYGDYIQWGADIEASFIEGGLENKFDWDYDNDPYGATRKAKWTKTDGSSICPRSYRIPTIAEFQAELVKLEEFHEFFNPQFAGALPFDGSVRTDAGSHAFVWASDVNTTKSSSVIFSQTSISINNNNFRASGLSVRCIKD